MSMNVKPIPTLDARINDIRLRTAEILNDHILPNEGRIWARNGTDSARAGRTLVRALDGLPPVEHGDVVCNPTYIGYRMQKQAGYESDLFRLALYDRKSGQSRPPPSTPSNAEYQRLAIFL